MITEWVDGHHDPGAMYARAASGQDFHRSSSSSSSSGGGGAYPLGPADLHAFALYIYDRLRARGDWRECYESLEVGVRLDVGVGRTEGKAGEKRFFVNEVTRFYGADYFSQHTLGAPQQEVCWAFAEAMDGYFGVGNRGG